MKKIIAGIGMIGMILVCLSLVSAITWRHNGTDTMSLDDSGNLTVTGNLTLSEKITFTFGEIIDNIVNGWIRITGGLNVTGNVIVEGNLTVDTNTLFVDAVNNRVGIGTTTPQNTLNVVGDVNITGNLFASGEGLSNINLLDDDLVLNMPFDTNTLDYSGKSNDGTKKGGVFFNATGGYDGFGAYEFDETGDYIDLGDVIDLSVNFTVMAWVNIGESQGSRRTIVSKYIGTSGLDGFEMYVTPANVFDFFVRDGGTTVSPISVTSALNNTWQHITGVYNGTDVLIYVNGVEENSEAFTSVLTGNSNRFLIGARDKDGTAEFYFNGTIDEVMVFNRTLTSQEIKRMFEGRKVSQSTVMEELNVTGNVNITGIYYGNGSQLTDIGSDSLLPSSINTTHILDNTILGADISNGTITDIDISDTTNLTLGQRLVFALGGFIQNIVSGRVDINGTLNVTGGLNVDSGTLFVNETNDRVGIGTTTPQNTLNVVGDLNVTGTSYLGDVILTSNNITVNNILSRDGNITFYNSSGSETVRITNNGRVGIGTTTPNNPLEIASTTTASMGQTRWSDEPNSGAGIVIQRSRGSSIGNDTIVQDGDKLSGLNFRGYDGVAYRQAAIIQSWVDGTPGLSDMPGRLTFSTSADGSSSPTERLRIDSSGNVGIGTTSPTQKLDVNGGVNISGVYYGNGSGLTDISGGALGVDSINTTQIIDGTIVDADISDTTNLTLGQKIVFALGGFIQNIISGQVDVNGTLNVTDNLIVQNNLTVGNNTLFVDSDNNFVGINTTTPQNELNVIGDLNITGNSYLATAIIPSPTVWNISSASLSQNFSLSFGAHRSIFFKPDGTKMFVLESQNVNEYDLSTAWNVSSASFNHNFSVNAQESNPSSVFFRSDGLKMFISGTDGDDINEYNLSTPWNVSTAVFVQTSPSLTGDDDFIRGIFFKPDGLKMFTAGALDDEIDEYDLSTPWDVSTVSLNQSLSISAQVPTGVFFRSDGLKMFVSDSVASVGVIYEYNLSTAWDVGTASFIQNLGVGITAPNSVFFKPDGARMYVLLDGPDLVFEYNLGIETITKVGIGTANPTQTLDVRGNVNISGVYYGDGSQLTGVVATDIADGAVTNSKIAANAINTTQIIDGTITDTDISDTTNLTLGQKITFTFGEVIDNIVDGWIRITGGLNVSDNLIVEGNLTVDTDTLFVDSVNNRVGIGTTTPSGTLTVNSSNADGSLRVYNTTGSEHFFVNGSSGKVGIGTASPTQALDVNGSVNIADDLTVKGQTLNLGDSTSSDARFLNFKNSAGTGKIYQASGGNAGLLVIDSVASKAIRFDHGGIEYMRIDADGDVGIGTTSPSSKLDVNGSAIIRGDLNVTGTSYLGDVILTSDNITVNNILPKDGGVVNVEGNLTLGQKITFTFGEVIDNIVNGFIRITGGLNITGDANIGGDLTVGNLVLSGNSFNATNDAGGISFNAADTTVDDTVGGGITLTGGQGDGGDLSPADGGGITITGGKGGNGAGSGAARGTGGTTLIKGGSGGGGQNQGSGGDAILSGGDAPDEGNVKSATGGAAIVKGGDVLGTSTTNSGTAGTGGIANITGGRGGDGGGTVNRHGGPGGNVIFTSGIGGDAITNGSAGNGGNLNIDAGIGGVAFGTGANGTNGTISIGGASAVSISSGSGSTMWTHDGDLNVTRIYYGNGSGLTNIGTSSILDGTITDADISDTTNLTLGQKITFTFGEVIDNIVNGFIRITGGLNVTGNAIIQGNLTVDTNTLFVDSNNNRVGIGTTSPEEELHVVVAGNSTPGIIRIESLIIPNADGTQGIHLFKNNGELYGWKIEGSGRFNSDATLEFISSQNEVDVIRMIIKRDTGEVGIGTTTPTQKLDVNGSVNVSGVYYGNGSGLTNVVASDLDNGIVTNSKVAVNAINTTQIIDGTIIADDLATGSVNTTHIVDGTIVDADISDSTNLTLGQRIVFALGGFIQNIISGQVDIDGTLNVTGGLNVDSGTLFVDETNNRVGIGTTDPDSKLHVTAGNIAVTNYPNTTSTGDIVGTFENGNQQIEFGTTGATNDRRAWILARHSNVPLNGGFFSTLHLQPDIEGTENDYEGVAIRYNTSIKLDSNVGLAVGGDVGIGTITPTQKLDVNGNVNVSGVYYGNGSGLTGILGSSITADSIDGTELADTLTLDAAMNVVGGFDFSVNTSDLFIDVSTGRVGIGTSNPTNELTVISQSNNNDIFEIRSSTNKPLFQLSEFGTDIAVMDIFNSSSDVVVRLNSQGNSYFVGGNVGIGTTSPAVKLHINLSTNGTVLRLQDIDGTCNQNPEAGSLTISCSSDEKLKENIREAESALEEFEDIKIKDYVVKASGKETTGVIAQEIQKTHPELVHEEDGELFVEQPNPWKLLKAIQELKEMIESLIGGNYSFGSTGMVIDEDSVGQAVVLLNSTSVRVEFSEVYSTEPIVTVTPIGLPNFFYGVDNITTTGFNIVISEAQEKEVVFNWHAFPQPRKKIEAFNVSNATEVNITNQTELNETQGIGINDTIPNETIGDINETADEDNETVELIKEIPELNETIDENNKSEEEINQTVVINETENIEIGENLTGDNTSIEENSIQQEESQGPIGGFLITWGIIDVNEEQGNGQWIFSRFFGMIFDLMGDNR